MLEKLTQFQKDMAAHEGYDDYVTGDTAEFSATRVFYRVMGHNRWQDYEDWDQLYVAYNEGYEAAAKLTPASDGQKFTKLRIEADLADGTLVTFNLPERTIRAMGGNREYALKFINAIAEAVEHLNKGDN